MAGEPFCGYPIGGKAGSPCVRPKGHRGRHRPAGYYEDQAAKNKERYWALPLEERVKLNAGKNERRSDRQKHG